MTLEQLTKKVTHLERAISELRREINKLSRKKDVVAPPVDFAWLDKTAAKRTMDEIFEKFSIDAESIGAEALQEMMERAKLAPNEISRSLVEARDE